MILEVHNLHKHYGSIHALNDVSFKVPEGSVYGILGPNGSGKTTLLGIIMNVLNQSSGTFKIFGEEPDKKHRREMGTLLETPNFYHYLNAIQNLKITAAIKGRSTDDIERVLTIVDLMQRRNSKFSTYSLGMKQRLAVANCLLGDPKVLVFDEPTNGLDPVGIAETRELIKKLNKLGKTIIMASHLLDEVEKVCTHVAILQKGVLLTDGHVDEILINEDIVEVSGADIELVMQLAGAFPSTISVRKNALHVELLFPSGEANLETVNRYYYEKGIVLNHLRLRRKSLESKFFELTQNNKR